MLTQPILLHDFVACDATSYAASSLRLIDEFAAPAVMPCAQNARLPLETYTDSALWIDRSAQRPDTMTCARAQWRSWSMLGGFKGCKRFHTGSCLDGMAALASVLPGRVLSEAAGTVTLAMQAVPMDALESSADLSMPCLRHVTAIERSQGLYPVTIAFLKLLDALLTRRCLNPQIHVGLPRPPPSFLLLPILLYQ